MSSQNNMAKESSSLQNHIVWLCSIFVTQNIQIMHKPSFSQAIVSHLLCSQTFSTPTQYMSVSHGYITIGEIEYGGGCKKREEKTVSHQLGVSKGYGDAH